MGSLTNRAEALLLNHCLKVGSYTPKTNIYLALFESDPTDTGGVAGETNYTSYARTEITFASATTRSSVQAATVTFPTATGAATSTVTHWGVCETNTRANADILAHGTLSAAKGIVPGKTPFIDSASGQVTISFSPGAVYTTFANKMLDFMFRNQSLTTGAHIYMTLHSATCADAAAGTELTGNGYARGAADTWDSCATSATGASQNGGAILLGTASANWSNAVATSLYWGADNTTTDGMFYATVGTALVVSSGETARFAAGAWDITLD